MPDPATSVRLNGTDLAVSRIGFGCASLMRLPSARARRELIAAVLAAGLTHFDVARMYGLGAAEGELGRALRGRRAEVTIATKFGIDVSGALRWLGRVQAPARALLARSSATRTAVRSQREVFVGPRVYDADRARLSLDKSLRSLAVDHVDVLFLHDPRPQDEIDPGLGAFLEQARAAGKIRAWGMSIDNPANVGVLSRLPLPTVAQVRHDVLGASTPRPASIAFGVMSAHSDIATWLSDMPEARRRWSEAIGADPLADDLLAKLLVGHTLQQDGVAAALYSTTRPSRLRVAAAVIGSAVRHDQLAAFAGCLSADRAAIAARR